MRLLTVGSAAVQLVFLVGLHHAPAQPPQSPPAEPIRPTQGLAVPQRDLLDARLQEILARPDYRRAMRGRGHDPRNVGQWLLLRLRQLLSRLGGLHETNYGLFLVAVVAGSLLLIAILTHIAYTFLQAFKAPGRRRRDARRAPGRSPVEPSALIRQADEFAAQGDHRSAVRSLYLALIRSLQMKGALPRSPSRTNWEHLKHLAGRPALAAVVRPFTQAFDEKWYGGHPTDDDDVMRCRQWLQEALQTVESE